MNAPKNPMGCYEESRFPSREAMLEEIVSVYRPRPVLRIPEPAEL
jgi:2,4-dienoyl-CoA reductase (NADPH2)